MPGLVPTVGKPLRHVVVVCILSLPAYSLNGAFPRTLCGSSCTGVCLLGRCLPAAANFDNVFDKPVLHTQELSIGLPGTTEPSKHSVIETQGHFDSWLPRNVSLPRQLQSLAPPLQRSQENRSQVGFADDAQALQRLLKSRIAETTLLDENKALRTELAQWRDAGTVVVEREATIIDQLRQRLPMLNRPRPRINQGQNQAEKQESAEAEEEALDNEKVDMSLMILVCLMVMVGLLSLYISPDSSCAPRIGQVQMEISELQVYNLPTTGEVYVQIQIMGHSMRTKKARAEGNKLLKFDEAITIEMSSMDIFGSTCTFDVVESNKRNETVLARCELSSHSLMDYLHQGREVVHLDLKPLSDDLPFVAAGPAGRKVFAQMRIRDVTGNDVTTPKEKRLTFHTPDDTPGSGPLGKNLQDEEAKYFKDKSRENKYNKTAQKLGKSFHIGKSSPPDSTLQQGLDDIPEVGSSRSAGSINRPAFSPPMTERIGISPGGTPPQSSKGTPAISVPLSILVGGQHPQTVLPTPIASLTPQYELSPAFGALSEARDVSNVTFFPVGPPSMEEIEDLQQAGLPTTEPMTDEEYNTSIE